MVNFFDVVYDNVANIHELERDFVRRGEATRPELPPVDHADPSHCQQQNSSHEPVTKYALVDVRAFDIFSALDDDPKARNLIKSSTIITNSEAFDLIMNKSNDKTAAFHFGPYVDPPSTHILTESDFFVLSAKRPCM